MERAPDPDDQLASPSPAATVRPLLVAYADTLHVLDGLPLVPMVATRWHWLSRPDAPIRLPRASWMLRSLTLWHIDRVLAGLEQALRRRSAIGTAQTGEAETLSAVTAFRASLPSRSRALRLGVLVVAALLLGRLIAALLPHLGRSPSFHATGPLDQLFDSTLGTLQLSAGSIGSAVDTLFQASPAALAAAALLLSVSLYLLLRPVASAFRLKRLLLNLYPDAESRRSDTPASWSVSRSAGAYCLEQQTFTALGARGPSEPPLDLLVALPLPLLALAACAVAIGAQASEPHALVNAPLVGAVALIVYGAPAVFRLAWLAAAWRARRGGPRSAWLFSDAVSVPWRATPVQCRSPAIIGWMSLVIMFTYPVLWWPWWSTARDLRDLGRAYDVRHLRDISPVAQALGVFLCLFYGVPGLIVLLRAPRLVREAQQAAGLDRPVKTSVAWWVLAWPVLCVKLQFELNRLWQSEGARPGALLLDITTGSAGLPGGERAHRS
jgi:hypothetical protein